MCYTTSDKEIIICRNRDIKPIPAVVVETENPSFLQIVK